MSAPGILKQQRPGFRAGLCPASFAPRWQESIREITPGTANPKPSELFQPARSSASLQILLQRGQPGHKRQITQRREAASQRCSSEGPLGGLALTAGEPRAAQSTPWSSAAGCWC